MAFPFHYQLEAKDCGPACLKIILEFYGKHFHISEIKTVCSITRGGVSLRDIIEGGEKLGLHSTPIKSLRHQILNIPVPAILYWRQQHFVVLYRISIKKNGTKYFYISDPAFGRIKLAEEHFYQQWMDSDLYGIALIISPGSNFSSIRPSPKVKRQYPLFGIINEIWRTNLRQIVTSFILLVVSSICTWFSPFLFQGMIDKGVVLNDTKIVITLLVYQLLLFASQWFSSSISNMILIGVNFKTSLGFLEKYLLKIIRLPIGFFDTKIQTDLLNRMDDNNRVQNFLTQHSIEFLIYGSNVLIFSFLLFFFNSSVFLVNIVGAITAILWTLAFLNSRKKLDYIKFYQTSETKKYTYELINDISEIKINNAQQKKVKQWKEQQSSLNNTELKSYYLTYYQQIGSIFAIKVKDLLATGFCAYLVISHRMSFGTMMTIGFVIGQLNNPIEQLIYLVKGLQDSRLSLDRLQEIQKVEDENINRPILYVGNSASTIRLVGVYFRYFGNNSAYVLSNVSFDIPVGKVTAIVGASGSGKTTLIKLLLSFYKCTEGSISVDSTNLIDINADTWRNRCGVVLQNGHIYNDSILNNIAFSDEFPNMERVEQAAQTACIHQFVTSLPLKYNTEVGGSGTELSGGQKQRILIARAVYKNPDFLFFDEATSSLDANNEKEIISNLTTFFKGKTVIIVAHRLSTVKNADRIIVLKNGHVIETGSHSHLTEQRGAYYELVSNQLELG